MSIILEALKRSREADTHISGIPSVDSEHFVAPLSSRPNLWVGLGAGLMFIAAGVALGVYVSREDAGGSSPTVQHVPIALKPIAVTPAEAEQQVAEATSVPSVTAVTNSVADPGRPVQGLSVRSVDRPLQVTPSAHVTALYERKQTPAATHSGVADGAAAETPLSETKPQSASVTVDKAAANDIDTDEVLQRVQAALGNEPLTQHDAPLLENLSQQQKDQIPSVMYSQHDWQSSGRASVVLNGKRLEVGAKDRGFTVEAILRDSVVLNWGGIRFRLRALNSWVNL